MISQSPISLDENTSRGSPGLIEEVRLARAETEALLLAVEHSLPWREHFEDARCACERLRARLSARALEMNEDTRGWVEAFVTELSVAQNELVLGSILGAADASGAGAMGRARRAVRLDLNALEMRFRGEQAPSPNRDSSV